MSLATLYHLLGRENRFGRITCQSRTSFCSHTLTLLDSVVKFLVFLVENLVQATIFCEQKFIPRWSKGCLPCAGAAPSLPHHTELGSSWGKDQQSLCPARTREG